MSARNGGKKETLIRKKLFIFKMHALYPSCPDFFGGKKRSVDFSPGKRVRGKLKFVFVAVAPEMKPSTFPQGFLAAGSQLRVWTRRMCWLRSVSRRWVTKQLYWKAGFHSLTLASPLHAPRRHRRVLLKLVSIFYCRADSLSCAMRSSFLYLSYVPCSSVPLTSRRPFRLPAHKQLHTSFWSCAVRALVTCELLTWMLKCFLLPMCTFFPIMLLSISPSSFYILGVVYFSSYFT